MSSTAQASLFADEESEIDIATRIRDELIASGRFPYPVTHLNVRRSGPGWSVQGFCPESDPPAIHAANSDRSGVWFQLYPKAIGETAAPKNVTAARFTILVRDEVPD